MSDKLYIDSHKLHYHPTAVADWNNGKRIYPVSLEISPSGACNHRCKFCSQSYLGYKRHFLDLNSLMPILINLKDKGVKSIVMAGEGEPLLNPQISQMVFEINQKAHMDVAMSTNAVLMTKDVSEAILPYLSWIRISLNASNPSMYQAVHKCSDINDFSKVLENIQNAVSVKKNFSIPVTIGVQYVLISENSDLDGLLTLAAQLKNIGVDYFSIKPYSIHPLSKSEVEPYDFNNFGTVYRKLNALSNDTFNVIIRENSIDHILEAKQYKKCLGIPFWAYIDSQFNVWPCLAYIGVEKYRYGNLLIQTADDVFEGRRHMKIVNDMCSMDITVCRKSCRLDPINEYLWRLKNGQLHQNFI